MFTLPTAASGKTLVLLGEAPGADEEIAGIPFVGSSGKMLSDLMAQAGLDRREWHILNTFIKRPPNNDLAKVDKSAGYEDISQAWTLNKTQWKREYGSVPTPNFDPPPLKKRYLRPEHHWQITELRERLRLLQPDLIVAMGATALWALTGEDAITLHRGNFFTCPYGHAIATLHPASVLYQYANLPLLWADLVKVRMWLEGTLPPPMQRRVWVNPTLSEIGAVYHRWLEVDNSRPLGVDIETCPSIGQITTVSFGFEDEAICIPFWDRHGTAEKHNFWPSPAAEVEAWRWVEKFAALPHPKVMQNGLYDAQYFLDAPIQIRLRNWRDDTAILQHAYQPELPKALGVLASLYLNEPSWKQMRASAKDMNKADE